MPKRAKKPAAKAVAAPEPMNPVLPEAPAAPVPTSDAEAAPMAPEQIEAKLKDPTFDPSGVERERLARRSLEE